MLERRLKEIEARKAEIRTMLQENQEIDLVSIKAELEALDVEQRSIREKQETAAKIASGEVETRTIEKPKGEDSMNDQMSRSAVLASPEYRSAFLKQLQGVPLTQAEQRAMTTGGGSAGAAIPTFTQNEIVRKVKERAPLLTEITLLQVAGNVNFAVEGTVADAALHTQNDSISSSADTLVTVSLGGYEVNKLVSISNSVATMSIEGFESWLTDMLSDSIADKISGYIINGTGSSQPQGIEKAQTWDSSNSITIGLSATPVTLDIQSLVGLLGGGYDSGAKFIMSKKTLFTDFMPLQDNAKYQLVTREGNMYYVYGYPVLIDDRVTYHEAFLANLKKAVVGNLAEEVNVKSQYHLRSNSYDFLGSAIFDCKIAIGSAVVKLVKAAE